MSTEADAFLADMLPKQRAAGQALHNGDVEPWLALWSRHDPVTLYGAKLSGASWSEVEPIIRKVGSWFADSVAFEFELVAAGVSGDVAYTVGYEHNDVTFAGQPTTYSLRVTHVYRHEDGQWHIAHRHGDVPPTSDGTATFPPSSATTGASAGETGAT
ncbi:MAG TPA: nuclear transport factor 2 family protein [Acidimicrobiales bacterium]|nr:nuclear transport factor 2 family protein [Acidimicrobiales bacterium]